MFSAPISQQYTLLRPLWGVDEDLAIFLPKLQRQKIFSGIEAGLIWQPPQQQEILRSFLRDSNFAFIGMVFTDLPFRQSFSVQEHIDAFHRQVDELLEFHPPLLINVHGGKDSFSQQQQEQFFSAVLKTAATLSSTVTITFETHRGRCLYSPWTALTLLQQFPDLLLCCDLSHWITVSERLLELQFASDAEILQLCAQRCRHIHARIGHQQAPQVSDPRAPEWQEHREYFEGLWKFLIQNRPNLISNPNSNSNSNHFAPITLTPEYGPFPYFPYLPQSPYSQQSRSEMLEEIVNWAGERLNQFTKTLEQKTC